jgi:hypothetical protein
MVPRVQDPDRVTRLLIVLRLPCVESHFLRQSVLVGDGEHLLQCFRVLQGQLADGH